MGKSGESPLLSRNCEVSKFFDISQNARLLSQLDEDRPMRFNFFVRKSSLSVLTPLFLLLTFFCNSAIAHHPFGMGKSTDLSTWQALLSGIGHPLLGPDHLLFMLGIAMVGLKKSMKWVFPLLAVGLAGSVLVQVQPLPDLVAPWAEALVSLTLAAEGLIVLNLVSTKWLFPMFSFHGYLLGSTIIGAEPTPLVGYFLGLLLAQLFLLLLVTQSSQSVMDKFGLNVRKILAGVWIGIGLAFSWVALIP
tara:strand:- start:5539 stop:6282 length:744 start_codon:yes stop_codon:yes gene_type:complete